MAHQNLDRLEPIVCDGGPICQLGYDRLDVFPFQLRNCLVAVLFTKGFNRAAIGSLRDRLEIEEFR